MSKNLDPKKTAVIVVDVSNDFVYEGGVIAGAGGPDYTVRAQKTLAPLARLLDAARKSGATVIYTTDTHNPEDYELTKWPPHSMKGTWNAEVCPEIAPQPGDVTLEKTTYSGFVSSELDKVLKEKGIETLMITGLTTDCCCRHTSGDAFQRGYGLVWITDAMMAFTPEAHQTGLDYFKAWYATDPESQFLTADQAAEKLTRQPVSTGSI